jgi:hypothetical protein
METRSIGWQDGTSTIDPEEWTAGGVLEDMRRITTGFNQQVQELDEEYRRNRARLLEEYVFNVGELLKADAMRQDTQQIATVAPYGSSL